MMIYGIYENDETETCRFVGTIKEIAEEFDCEECSVRSGISKNYLLKGKYKIVKLFYEKNGGKTNEM